MNRRNSVILIFSVFSAGFISLFASSFPDGLEYVAEKLGFIGQANNYLPGLFSEYAIPGLQNDLLASGFAGILGVAAVFIMIVVFFNFLIIVQNQFLKAKK